MLNQMHWKGDYIEKYMYLLHDYHQKLLTIFKNTWSVNKVIRLPAYRTIWQHCGLALHAKGR